MLYGTKPTLYYSVLYWSFRQRSSSWQVTGTTQRHYRWESSVNLDFQSAAHFSPVWISFAPISSDFFLKLKWSDQTWVLDWPALLGSHDSNVSTCRRLSKSGWHREEANNAWGEKNGRVLKMISSQSLNSDSCESLCGWCGQDFDVQNGSTVFKWRDPWPSRFG